LPEPRAWKAGFVGRRLRELGQHLTELSRRVRETVAEAVRETVARVARDAVDRVLPGRIRGPIGQPQFYENDKSYDAREEFDPWAYADEPEPWGDSQTATTVHTTPEISPAPSGLPLARSAIALALAAAGWWLGRQGSWWSAFAVGLIAGAAAVVTRRLTGDGLLLVQAAHDFLTYRQAFADPGDV
jgi:hypothetical protein